MHASAGYGSPSRSPGADTQRLGICLRKETLITNRLHTASVIQMLLVALITVSPAFGQGRHGGRCMMMGDAAHGADMQLFHRWTGLNVGGVVRVETMIFEPSSATQLALRALGAYNV